MNWDQWAVLMANGADLTVDNRREVRKDCGLYIGTIVMCYQEEDIVIQELGGGRWVAHRYSDLDETEFAVPGIERFMEVLYAKGRGVVCGL